MDLILYNGNLVTMDEKKPQAQAVAIKKGIIVAVGDNTDILDLKTEHTQLIDIKGKTVIPGLNDSHLHLYSMGLFLNLVNLSEAKSIDSLKKTVKEYIENRQIVTGQWVRGRGWNQDYFIDETRFITKADLDDISTEHPILLYRACGHVMVVNSKAIEICGLDETTEQIFGGEFDLESGLFREKAVEFINQFIPEPSIDEIKEILIFGMNYANSQGLTSLQTDDLAHLPSRDFKKMLQAYQELHDENKLTCRIYQQSLMPDLKALETFLELGYKTGVGDELFKIGPLKILSDGSLGARTAALTNPYHDDPTTRGILTFKDEELFALIHTAHINNMQIAVHCIGDRAMHQVLNMIDKVNHMVPRMNHRHTIIHCQIMDEHLINRYKESQVVALVQPIFLHYDLHVVESRVGLNMATSSYAFNTMIKKGIPVALGTDSPIEPINTMPNLYCAVTRQDLSGHPSGGWNPSECLSVHDAIFAYTTTGAYASFEESIKGRIKVSQLADLVILDQDIFNIEAKLLLDTKIEMTLLGGHIVYKR